jgi:hypothetical protein
LSLYSILKWFVQWNHLWKESNDCNLGIGQVSLFAFVLSKHRRLQFVECMDDMYLSHPYFGQVWGWSPTLGKVGIMSPLGLPNVQSSTERLKTPRIGVFLVSLKRSWNVDIENGLALAIWTSAAQVMGKRRARSQTGSLTPDH